MLKTMLFAALITFTTLPALGQTLEADGLRISNKVKVGPRPFLTGNSMCETSYSSTDPKCTRNNTLEDQTRIDPSVITGEIRINFGEGTPKKEAPKKSYQDELLEAGRLFEKSRKDRNRQEVVENESPAELPTECAK